MKSVLYHKPDSQYDDITGEQYHFPSQYLSRIEKSINDWVVYYGPIKGEKGRFYSGIAKLENIRPDQNTDKHYYADLKDYIDFDRYVEYKENGGFEKRLIQKDGSVNGGYAVHAVRPLDESEFVAILEAGLSTEDEWPDRYDEQDTDNTYVDDQVGFGEDVQQALSGAPYERPITEQLTRRKWRDKKFKKNIRVAYDRTCAFTGMRLINGKGRPEVEAAHIRPVEQGGNDWIRNGIALSGTVHWMFDRGLLSLDNDFTILESRQLNYDISTLIHKDKKAKVPKQQRFQPHPTYLEWHRENVFKF